MLAAPVGCWRRVRIEPAAFGMDHFQSGVALADLAETAQPRTRLSEQLLLGRAEVEEAQGQGAATVAQVAEQEAPAARHHFGVDDVGFDLRLGAGTQQADGNDAGAVLIARGQVQQNVFDGADTEPTQPVGQSRADALQNALQSGDRQRFASWRSRHDPRVGFFENPDFGPLHPDYRLTFQHQHGVHLDLRAARQGRDTDSGPRRIRLREVLGHDLVHRSEMCQIGQKHVELDRVGETAAGRIRHRRQIVEHATRICASTPPSTSCPVAGSSGICPDR